MPGAVQQQQQANLSQAIVPVTPVYTYDPTLYYGMHGYVPSYQAFQGNGVSTPFPGMSFWTGWGRSEEAQVSSPKAAPSGLQRFPSVKLPEDPLNELTDILFSEPPTLQSQPSLKVLKQQQPLPKQLQLPQHHPLQRSAASSAGPTLLSSTPSGPNNWSGFSA